MALSKQFVMASIVKKANCYVLRVRYNYYGMYDFEVVSIHASMALAKDELIKERCNDKLEIVE